MAKGTFYDELYRSQDDYFGAQPSGLLLKFHGLIKPRGRVLDLGAGQGRNALFLAQKGFRVDAVDNSEEAVKQLLKKAHEKGLRVRCFLCDVRVFEPPVKKYDAVLAFGLIQDLFLSEAIRLFQRVEGWTRAGGLVFVSAFTVQDAKYREIKEFSEEVEPNSFRTPSGKIRTFLEKDQILRFLPDFEVVHHWEGLGRWHSHGELEKEQHAVARLVVRRLK